MDPLLPHRKLVKHYDEPGHIHELTFSCYQRRKLLTNDRWRGLLADSIQTATEKHCFHLLAYVFMPEHVHLLVWPARASAKISPLLTAIKQPFSHRIRKLLADSSSPLLAELTIRDRPGKTVFRYWQEGSGYDRNLTEAKTVQAAIDYIHLNPVRRQLVKRPEDWRWSSYRYYQQEGLGFDTMVPRITPLPNVFWDT